MTKLDIGTLHFQFRGRFIAVKGSAKCLPEIFNDHDPLEAKLVWEITGLESLLCHAHFFTWLMHSTND